MDDVDYTQLLRPYSLEDYVAMYVNQSEEERSKAFKEASDCPKRFDNNILARMLRPPSPLPWNEELAFVVEAYYHVMGIPLSMPPWRLSSLDEFNEFMDRNPTQPQCPAYSVEDYVTTYMNQRENERSQAFAGASEYLQKFDNNMTAPMLLPAIPLPSHEELDFPEGDHFDVTASPSGVPPWPLNALDGLSEFADTSPTSTGPLTPPSDLYTGFDTGTPTTPRECWSGTAFPPSTHHQIENPSPAFSSDMGYDWPTEPQY